MPDKAIDLMDEASATLRMSIDSKPEDLDTLDRKILQLKIEKEALKKIEKHDKRRAAYHDYYCKTKWGKASSYDVCVNSSLLGIDGTVDFLYDLVQKYITEVLQLPDSILAGCGNVCNMLYGEKEKLLLKQSIFEISVNVYVFSRMSLLASVIFRFV